MRASESRATRGARRRVVVSGVALGKGEGLFLHKFVNSRGSDGFGPMRKKLGSVMLGQVSVQQGQVQCSRTVTLMELSPFEFSPPPSDDDELPFSTARAA